MHAADRVVAGPRAGLWRWRRGPQLTHSCRDRRDQRPYINSTGTLTATANSPAAVHRGAPPILKHTTADD